MKGNKILLILLFTCIGFAPLNKTKAQSVDVDVNFSMFQEDLSPYGRWVTNPRFGEVWIYSDANFKPYYTDGHWEYTNYGWSWVSDFDWGWAPFHYGRWEYDPFYGWMWIPGYEWASAWVSWSSYDDYYGWAPLGYGVSINVSFGSIPYDRWTFIPRQNICDRDIRSHYISPGRNHNFRNAVVINNYYGGRFTRGPQRSEVERYTHNRIEERRVTYRGRPQNVASNDRRDRNNNQNANTNNRQDRTNSNGQRRFDDNRPGNENNDQNGNTNNRQDRTNSNRQRRFDNNRPANENNDQNGNTNSRRRRDMNTSPNPPENNPPRRQMERRNNEQQQNNVPVIRPPRENSRQMNPVREQRNQPSMETRRPERPERNYDNGQGRQRNNDNNRPQQQDRPERKRRN